MPLGFGFSASSTVDVAFRLGVFSRRSNLDLETRPLRFKDQVISDPISIATDLLYVLLLIVNLILAVVIWAD